MFFFRLLFLYIQIYILLYGVTHYLEENVYVTRTQYGKFIDFLIQTKLYNLHIEKYLLYYY